MSDSSDDLTSVAWVHEELRRSLDAAHKALRRFAKETDSLAGSDVDAVDPSVLRVARAQFHQGVGALELVGLPAAALVLRASEALVQRAAARPQLLTPAVLADIERASFALLDYLGRMLAGKTVSPLSLFPQYRALQDAHEASRFHPADLWSVDWRWRGLPVDARATARQPDADVREVFESQLLALMRDREPQTAARRIGDACADLGAGATAPEVSTLWKLASAVFEAQAEGLLRFDVFTKRVASRLLSQLRVLERGEHDVSERLARDLLFFCAQSDPPAVDQALRLAAARGAYGLTAAPVDYSMSVLGRFDPSLVAQAKKRVAAAKEAWSAVAGGEMHRIGGLGEQFALVADSLRKLFPGGDSFGDELQQAISQTQQAQSAPAVALAMEVATSLLYTEAALEDSDFDDPEHAARVTRMAERLAHVRVSGTPDPLESWMEDLYRRVSDRQTMGSVVQELRTALAEAEKSIDQFFRDPADPAVLIPVPQQLASMRGVLCVLGMDEAASALLAMRDEIEALVSAAPAADPPGDAVFGRIAGNLSALGFLIDMLSVQPHLAKSLFVYDAAEGTLSPVMGRSQPSELAQEGAAVLAPAIEPRLVEQAQLLAFSSVREDVPLQDIKSDLERLSLEAQAADQPALAAAVMKAQEAFRQSDDPAGISAARAELSEALVDFVATSSEADALVPEPALAPRSAPLPATPVSDFQEDDEMRGVFLEEAAEVIQDAKVAVAELTRSPGDIALLTTLRRAFHTLKGSSRMVGLADFGEAAWICEQLYNSQLAEQRAADSAFIAFTSWSLGHLAAWSESIAAHRQPTQDVATMRARAAALAAPASGGRSEATLPLDAGRPLAATTAAMGALAATASPGLPANLSSPADLDPIAPPLPSSLVTDPALDAGLELAEMADAIDRVPTGDASADLSSDPEVQALFLSVGKEAAFEAEAPPSDLTATWPDGGRPVDMDVPPHAPETVIQRLIPSGFGALDLGAAAAPSAGPAGVDDGESMPLVTAAGPALVEFIPGSPEHDAGLAELATEPAPDAMFAAHADADTDSDALTGALELADAGHGDATATPTDVAAPPDPEPPHAAASDGFGVTPDDENVKVIGDLRINIPLFNIYLNEADELSRRLSTEVAEWAMELRHPIGEAPIALAHSLAGSSATVGFADLSHLARVLEHAQMRSQAIGSGTREEAALFVEAADEIRRLLHQFAAGFLKAPSEDLLQRLAGHELSSARRLEAALAASDHPRDSTAGALPLPAARTLDAAFHGDFDRHASARDNRAPDAIHPDDVETAPARLGDFAPTLLQDDTENVAPGVTPSSAAPAEPRIDLSWPALAAPEAESGRSSPAGFEPTAFEPSHPVPLIRPESLGSEALSQAQPEPVWVDRADLVSTWPTTPPESASATESTPVAGPAEPLARFETLGVAELKPLAALSVEDLKPTSAPDRLTDDEEDLDAVDAVDPELFPIFEEEGSELVTQLASQLRDWARLPDSAAAPAACMRTLHTLKGGARLAGAMRLGELAHRLETQIEHALADPPVFVEAIDALQSRCDVLAQTLERLRHPLPAPSGDRIPASAPVSATAAVAGTVAATPASAASHAQSPNPSTPLVDGPGAQTPSEVPTVPALDRDETRPAAAAAPAAPSAGSNDSGMDWTRFSATSRRAAPAAKRHVPASQATVRVRAPLLDRLVNLAGEVSITRSRVEVGITQIKSSLTDLTDNLERLRGQLRDIEIQGDMQMTSRIEAAKAAAQTFDPLEFDRFTRFQELTRMMAESVNDVATVQRALQRSLESTEDELVAQARMTRDLQDDLLRTRMVEFEGISDRLYRVVRQAAKETGKQVRLDIAGGSIEVDRGVLDRMTGSFEHLLRNCVTHGIEAPEARQGAGKDPTGSVIVAISQEGNEVGIEFRDDGRGLDLGRIRAKGLEMGLIDATAGDKELANLIFTPGFSTASSVTELSGRGVGMDVVRSEVVSMGGRIDTATEAGQGTAFKLILPLTTAVTQVVMLRCGDSTVAVPSTLVETVRRVPVTEADEAYATGTFALGDSVLPFFWLGALLQSGGRPADTGRTRSIVIVRSAQQRIAIHADEVVGNQEVVVKNLGPQLSRLPGLAGMTILASGVVTLIYNPVALATLYGEGARAATRALLRAPAGRAPSLPAQAQPDAELAPLVLVVDDSLTVRRVTQRLLAREGYRVALAKDGLDALERLTEERPAIVLSDIEMPRMDGFDLVRNIRADRRLAGLPVVMITSRIAQKHREHAAELGVDHYLGKPYAEEDLLALVRGYTVKAERA